METIIESTPKIPVLLRVKQVYDKYIHQMVDCLQDGYDPSDNLRRKIMLDLRSTLTSRNQLIAQCLKKKQAKAKKEKTSDWTPVPETWKSDIAVFCFGSVKHATLRSPKTTLSVPKTGKYSDRGPRCGKIDGGAGQSPA